MHIIALARQLESLTDLSSARGTPLLNGEGITRFGKQDPQTWTLVWPTGRPFPLAIRSHLGSSPAGKATVETCIAQQKRHAVA